MTSQMGLAATASAMAQQVCYLAALQLSASHFW